MQLGYANLDEIGVFSIFHGATLWPLYFFFALGWSLIASAITTRVSAGLKHRKNAMVEAVSDLRG